MSFLAVLGHTNIDVLLRVEEMPRADYSSPVKARRTVYGGTACNIARQAAGMGVPARLWSRVGGDFPLDWFAELEDDGLDLDYFDRSGELTPTCYIFTNLEEQQAFSMDQGAMTPPYTVPVAILDDLQASSLAPERGPWVHIGTGDPDSYLPLAQAAKDKGLNITFDPGQEIHFAYNPKQFEQLLNHADVFFCNEAELDAAFKFMRYGDPEQLLDHVDVVVVTRGPKGASLYQAGKKPVHLEALPAAVIDPTGAGDALRAGWYAGLYKGDDMVSCLRRGIAAATVIVQHLGPQSHIVTGPEVENLLSPLTQD